MHLTLVCQRPLDRLLDPPSTIGTQLATLCRVKPLDSLHLDQCFLQKSNPGKGALNSDNRARILTTSRRFALIIQARASLSPFLIWAPARVISSWGVNNGTRMSPSVKLNGRIRTFTGHPPTSPQIGSEATA